MVDVMNFFCKPKKTFAALIFIALVWLTFSLGQWQLGRAQEKQRLFEMQARALNTSPVWPTAAQLNIENLSYRPIELRGTFDPKALVYIDNRQINGAPAVQVVQGFEPEGVDFLIPVDRGLLPRDSSDPRRAPNMPVEALKDTERVALTGIILPHFAQSAELQGIHLRTKSEIYQEENNGFQVWSNFNLEAFKKKVERPVSHFVVTLQPIVHNAQTSVTIRKINGFYQVTLPLQPQVSKHRGYAFQWFAMSATLVVFTLFFVYREFYKGKKI